MRQQINLFQSVLIDKPEPLQARQARLILLLFFIVLGGLSLLGYWQMSRAERQAAELQQQKAELETVVSALELKFPERQKNALLEEEIHRNEATLASQQQLLGYFAHRGGQDNHSFLTTLEGLARHRSNGVWLRRIRLDAGGEVALAGSALRPEQVPEYVQSLGAQQVFSGKLFSRLSLTRLDKTAGQVDFSLESLAEETR